MNPVETTNRANTLTEKTVFRRYFDHLIDCEPSVPVTRHLLSNVQKWALDIEHGETMEIGYESWAAIFEQIIWEPKRAAVADRVSVVVLNVYGRFAEMVLQSWDFGQVRLPIGVAMTALARLQPEPYIKVLAGPPMSVLLLPRSGKIFGRLGNVRLSGPPFDIEFAKSLFSLYYFGVDTWAGAENVEYFLQPFYRKHEEDESDLNS